MSKFCKEREANPYAGFSLRAQKIFILPSCAESHGLQTVDEGARVPYEAPKERSGVCFGGFRPMKHVEEPRASARGGST